MLAFLMLAAVGAQLLEQRDSIDDHLNAYVVVRDGDRRLIAGCERQGSGEMRVQLQFDRYIGENHPGILAGGTELDYRFDDRPAEKVWWRSHDRVVFAEWEETRPLKFVLAMKGSMKAVVRAIRSDGEAVEMAFAYPDPTSTIDAVLDRCGLTSAGLIKPRSKH